MNKLCDLFKRPWCRSIINFSVVISSLIINFLIIDILGQGMPEVNFWIISITIIVLISGMFFVLWTIVSKYIEDIQFNDNREWDNKKKCDILDRNCCGDAVCKALSRNYKVEPDENAINTLDKEYSIFLQSHIIMLENEFYNNNGKEIMIVSSSLDSEVSLDGVRGASEAVKNNLLEGIAYHYFYAKSIDDPERAERNIRNIKEQYNNCGQFDFNYYDVPHDDLSEYLLYLFGIVIYIYQDEKYEAYFSIRQPNVEPVYRKMPICMAGRYVTMLNEIITGNTQTIAVDKCRIPNLVYKNYNNMTSELFELRRTVFVKEQKIPYHEEFEGDENNFLHCCIYDGDELVAGARVGFFDKEPFCARITRIVVKAENRKKGIGRKIVQYAETEALKLGYRKFVLFAQVQASEFYKKIGYTSDGDEFMEAGIRHIKMYKKL